MNDYTLQADVKVKENSLQRQRHEVHKMPDVGVIDSRYVLELKGSNQTLDLYAWPARLPRNELVPGLATHTADPFDWKADTWYT